MSITSRLFQKAVKVLRGGKHGGEGIASRKAVAPRAQEFLWGDDGYGTGSPFFEKMESRLLLSTVTIAAGINAAEGGADGTFTITRDDTAGDLTVNFSTKGKASLGATRDYTLSDGVDAITRSVVIPDGQSFVTINVVANDDTLAEPTEDIIINLRSSRAYDLSLDFSTRTATIDLTDNEPVVTIVATDGSASEDVVNNVVDTGTFTITRVGDTTGDLLVRFSRTGNARFGTDYDLTVGGNALTSLQVVILDGQASVDIVVVPINDSRFESTEIVTLTLRNSSLFSLGTASAAVAIADNEPLIFIDPSSDTPPSFTIDTLTNLGADTYITTGTESGASHDGEPLEVRNAQGVAGAQSRKAYVSFDLGQFPIDTFSNVFFTLTLIDVEGVSPNNTGFKFNVFGLKDDFVPTGNEQGELWNEDINYGDAPGNVADGGQVNLPDMFTGGPLGSFTIAGAGTIGQKLTISGQLITDYLNAESTLDGDNVVTFIIVRETIGEVGVDTVVHKFDSRDDAFGDATTRPQLTGVGLVAGLDVTEGDATSVRVFRDGSTVGDVTVQFNAKGAARLGLDYRLEVNGTPVTSSFVMPDGDAFVDIDVIALTDAFYEINESFQIQLRSNAAYVLDSQNTKAIVNVLDSGAVVTVSATDEDAQEPDNSSLNLDRGTFTITRTGSLAEDLDVNIRFGGTAREGTDFVTVGRVVTILAGSDNVVVNIDPLADTIPEGSEFVTLTLVASRNYGLNFLVTGNRTATGNPIRATDFAAASLADARRSARNAGIGAPRITTPEQSESVLISSGQLNLTPDLTGLLYSLAATTLDNDDVGTAIGTARIKNQGRSVAGAFRVDFYLSVDRELVTADDFLLGSITIAGLNAGGFIDASIVLGATSLQALGVVAGNYYIIADIDPDGFVNEGVEGNNTLVSTNPDITVID